MDSKKLRLVNYWNDISENPACFFQLIRVLFIHCWNNCSGSDPGYCPSQISQGQDWLESVMEQLFIYLFIRLCIGATACTLDQCRTSTTPNGKKTRLFNIPTATVLELENIRAVIFKANKNNSISQFQGTFSKYLIFTYGAFQAFLN